MTTSDESGSSGASAPEITTPRLTAAPMRAVAEIGAVAILSCAIMGAASALRHDDARGLTTPAKSAGDPAKTAAAPVTNPAEPLAADPAVQQDDPKAGPWIRAEPNPVPFAGEKGTTTITWNAPGSNDAKVYLRGPEKEELFSGGSHGKETIDWIAPGGVYEFVLYADAEKKKELATLKITRPAK